MDRVSTLSPLASTRCSPAADAIDQLRSGQACCRSRRVSSPPRLYACPIRAPWRPSRTAGITDAPIASCSTTSTSPTSTSGTGYTPTPGSGPTSPSGRHTSRDATEQFVRTSIADWHLAGLGYWSVREEPNGPIIGCGGCRLVSDKDRWNLYYRFAPEVQGRGYASELARAAVAAANEVDPARPVVAYMLEHNTASWRVAERVGLTRVWAGPDEGNPDPGAIGLVYADRPDVTV